MQKITTFFTFDDQAEAAANLYTSLFEDGKIIETTRYGEAGPKPKGTVMTVTFECAGQRFVALNGGPNFTFSQGISLSVATESQAETDELWARLEADGGKPVACGWITDRFGVSWQITPTMLPRLLSNPDRAVANRVMQAMMKMVKIDIAALEAAARG